MPAFVEMDERTPLSTQMEENVGPVVLINQFTVELKEADDLLTAWAADAAWMKQQPRFISTQLHRGIARTTLALLLSKRGHHVTQAEGVQAAAKALADESFDVVVTDLRMPDGDGLEVLRTARAHAPDTAVIILTAYAGWESAKEAMQFGAFDYFEKGREPDELLHRIGRALAERSLRRENENLRGQVRERFAQRGLIARSAEMRRVLDLIARVAPTDATVLIQGESGTGKELIAKALHHTSRRAEGPFVAVNCGALPETLLESEIFGHVKGAFTGATVSKRGLFEEAHGGTFLLDEVGEMSPSLQVKLLRALQDGEVRRVGANQPTIVDARVVAATNRDLQQRVREGAFREDLFYRLNVIPVTLPPLRERREDIPLLAETFLERVAQKQGRTVRLSADAVECLLRYPWPGNVRELENVMERTAILSARDMISAGDLPAHIAAGIVVGAVPNLPTQEGLAEVERVHILQTLERVGWNHSRAAEVLKIGRTTLWRKLKEYGLTR